MGKNDSMDLALSCSATLFSWRDRVWIAYHCPVPTDTGWELGFSDMRFKTLKADFVTTPPATFELLAMTAFIASPCHLGSRDPTLSPESNTDL
jgi:hypothetical protein